MATFQKKAPSPPNQVIVDRKNTKVIYTADIQQDLLESFNIATN